MSIDPNLDPPRTDTFPGPVCERCGSCCRQGGPTLHKGDQALIDGRILTWADLVTLRKGEPVYDNLHGRLSLNPTERIKIRGTSGKWSCRFLDSDCAGCGIYAQRPAQCRYLFCRDNRDFLKHCRSDFLDRRILFQQRSEWWELVLGYEQECSFARHVRPLLQARLNKSESAADRRGLKYVVDFDHQYRSLSVERARLPREWLGLFFGQALTELVPRILKDPRLISNPDLLEPSNEQ